MRSTELVVALGGQVTLQTVQRLAKRGVIPAKRLPLRCAQWNFSPNDVEQIRAILIKAGLIEPAQPGSGNSGDAK